MKLKTIQWVFGCVAAAALLILYLGLCAENLWVMAGGLVLCAADIVFFWTLYRCPECRGRLRGGEAHCPHCGIKLER